MENLIFAKVGDLFGKMKTRLFPLLICSLILSGCASSSVSRDIAANIDLGRDNAQKLVDNVTDGDIVDTYGNASQTAKGAVVGGAAGALVGAFTTGVGLFPGASTGAVLGASYGKYIDMHTTFEDRLKNRGATVVVLGDQILILVPSARIFDPWTSNINPSAYSTLSLLAQFINRYVKTIVKVAVYTSDNSSKDLDLSLSQQQAERVSRYLIASGLDARLVYAAGYGGTRLVVPNTGAWDSDNYRIEITLEKLYV